MHSAASTSCSTSSSRVQDRAPACSRCSPVASACRFGTPLRQHGRVQRIVVLTQHKNSRCKRRFALRVTAEYGHDMSTPDDSYLVLGLAQCFEKGDDGKLQSRMVIEPISAASLECMVAGAKTCFRRVYSLRLADALQQDKSVLPEEFAVGTFCEDWGFRIAACARTWLRPHAQDNLSDIVPLGQQKTNFNFNVDEKRVLNFENVVNDDDNIKQDMSIDVYGRKDKDDEEDAKQPAAEAEAPAEKQEDDVDALLAV